MTTVMMTTDAVGGVWTYSLELARALAVEGVEVALITIGPEPSAAQRAELAASPIVESHRLDLRLEWMDQPWSDVDATGEALLALAADIRPDVVHLNGYALAALPWTSPTVVVAHSDVVSWWRAVHHQPAPPEWDEYRRRITAGLDKASMVVAPTAAVLAELRAELGFVGGTVIANGRRNDWYVPTPKEPFILSAGRLWDPAKNIAALRAVAPLLDWPVHVAGAIDETMQPDDAGVHALGSLPFEQLAGWLARAAIYVAPARYEPFGLAALEAAHAGCALVLGDIPSLREVWGDAAVFVAPDDHGALAATLTSLTRDPDRCAELGAAAQRRAGRYGVSAVGQAYAQLYRALLHVPAGAS